MESDSQLVPDAEPPLQREATAEELASRASRLVLLTGASGYVGHRLLPLLAERGYSVRCMLRKPQKLDSALSESCHTFKGDVLDKASLDACLQGVHTAYYLIHSMASTSDFEHRDRVGAENFAAAAKLAGVKRIIYLGGLGDDDDPSLSPHLRSRHEVGRILRSSGVETIEFRSSAVLGCGSLSFELIRSLTNRLPIMICPKWLTTPTQPIAINDLLDYLIAAIELPPGPSQVFEIGCNEVVTYGQLIREYARQCGLRRWMISVPVLTPYLSGLWLGLVTPATAEVGRHLIEGLRNPTVVRDARALNVFSIRPMSIQDAMARAIQEL